MGIIFRVNASTAVVNDALYCSAVDISENLPADTESVDENIAESGSSSVSDSSFYSSCDTVDPRSRMKSVN